jgi:HAD superfamily hydrolase (TIGR01484 family)
MKYLAFATDYDGTLALNGTLKTEMVTHLSLLHESGRKLILVTGRIKEDLELCCPYLALFHRVIFENGAVLYHPKSNGLQLLTHGVPEELISLLREKRIEPLSIGRCILATQSDNELTVTQCIQKLGLPYSLTFNKNSLMVLPNGINKGTGLIAALQELSLPPSQTVGIGDAENDEALLQVCGMSYAVAEATPGQKAIAQITTQGGAHYGPMEVIQDLLLQDVS